MRVRVRTCVRVCVCVCARAQVCAHMRVWHNALLITHTHRLTEVADNLKPGTTYLLQQISSAFLPAQRIFVFIRHLPSVPFVSATSVPSPLFITSRVAISVLGSLTRSAT